VADCINMTRTRTLRYNYSFIDKLQADILTFCEKKKNRMCSRFTWSLFCDVSRIWQKQFHGMSPS